MPKEMSADYRAGWNDCRATLELSLMLAEKLVGKSDTLTDERRAVYAEVFAAIRGHQAPRYSR